MVMKKILNLFFLLGCCASVRGQADSVSSNKNPFVVGLSAGATFPIGKFAKYEADPSDYNENIAGAPATGFNLRLNLDYYIIPEFGISLTLQHAQNNSKAPGADELSYNPYQGYGLGEGFTRESYSYNGGNWKINEVAIGAVLKTLHRNIDLSFRVNGGIIRVSSPKAELFIDGFIWQTNSPNQFDYRTTTTQPAIQTFSLCVSAQADAHFYLNAKKNLSILISLEYLTARCIMEGEQSLSVNGGGESINNISFTKNVNTLGVNAGMAWAFR